MTPATARQTGAAASLLHDWRRRRKKGDGLTEI